MEDIIKQWTIYLATGIEAAAAVLIGVAALKAVIRGFILLVFDREDETLKENVRLELGRWLW